MKNIYDKLDEHPLGQMANLIGDVLYDQGPRLKELKVYSTKAKHRDVHKILSDMRHELESMAMDDFEKEVPPWCKVVLERGLQRKEEE